jgi:hypothetical protein
MPIGPNNISTIRHDIIQRACYEIDVILQDPHKSRDSCRGDSDDYYYSFILPGLLSPKEKEELIGLYLPTGWGRVIVQNSGELNERPGLFMVKLYLKEDSRHLRI